MSYTFKRNYSNIDKLKYFTKMSHGTIKLYYNQDNNNSTNTEGLSKNGSIIKMDNNLFCVANLNDIMLRSITKEDINYKNINLLEHLSLNDLKIDRNYIGESLIEILNYTCLRTQQEFIIITSSNSINIYNIIENNLEKTFTHKFFYTDLNRKTVIYNEFLYTISKEGMTLIPLYDITNEFIGKDIIRLIGVNEDGINVHLNGTGIKVDNARKLLYIYNVNNNANIYIYSIESPYQPKFINSYCSLDSKVKNISFFELSSNSLNNLSLDIDNNFILITTNTKHYIINSTVLWDISYLGDSKNDRDLSDLLNIIHIKDNIFLSINEVNSALVFLELISNNSDLNSESSCEGNDEHINNELSLNWKKTIKLDDFSTITDIKYIDDKLYILNNTNGLLVYKIINEDEDIELECLMEIDSYRYNKNNKSEGSKSIVLLENKNYLLDSCNGITIFTQGNNNKNIKLNLSNPAKNDLDYTKLPEKIFIHMEIFSDLNNINTNYIDFESKLLAIDKQLKIVLLYVPHYILEFIKPFNISDENKYNDTVLKYSYGININSFDYKKGINNIQITSDNYNIFTPKYQGNKIVSYNENIYGNTINTNNINLSGSIVMNENCNLNSFIKYNSKNTYDIEILKQLYLEYDNYLRDNLLIGILFKSYGINSQDTFIIENFDSSNNNRIIYYIVNDKHTFIVRKDLVPNIKTNTLYKVIDFNNKFIGFTKVLIINDIEHSNIPADYLNNNYLYFNAFFTDELSLIRSEYNEIYDNLENGYLFFIEQPIKYSNVLEINNDYNTHIFKSIHLDIDILSIEYLNSSDLNLILKSHSCLSKYSVNHFLDYKNRIGKGNLVINLGPDFIKFNTDKLLLGDIIIKIENNEILTSNLLYKTNINVEYYRFTQNTWSLYNTDITTISLHSDYDNLVI